MFALTTALFALALTALPARAQVVEGDEGDAAAPIAPEDDSQAAPPPDEQAPGEPPPAPEGSEPPPPPEAQAPADQPDQSAPVLQPLDATVPDGQWVYTTQYGWVWLPYSDTYSYVSPGGTPYMYFYDPAYGWNWYSAPWIVGYGPSLYFSYGVGVPSYGWYGHPYSYGYGYGYGGYGAYGYGSHRDYDHGHDRGRVEHRAPGVEHHPRTVPPSHGATPRHPSYGPSAMPRSAPAHPRSAPHAAPAPHGAPAHAPSGAGRPMPSRPIGPAGGAPHGAGGAPHGARGAPHGGGAGGGHPR